MARVPQPPRTHLAEVPRPPKHPLGDGIEVPILIPVPDFVLSTIDLRTVLVAKRPDGSACLTIVGPDHRPFALDMSADAATALAVRLLEDT